MKVKDLLKNMKILEISDNTILDANVSDITCDCNNIKANSVCVLYRGVNFDSHKVAPDIFKTGRIICFLSEESLAGLPYIKVENARRAQALVSKNYFKVAENSFFSIGITGTNGKTTISYLVDSIFVNRGIKTIRIGTVDYKIGNTILKSKTTTPSSYDFYAMLNRAKGDNINNLIAEVSSHALSQDRIYGFTFNLAVFTNLTGDHLDYHSSMEDYFRAKRSLFTKAYANTALINIDDIYGVRLFKGARINKYSYGFNKDADVHVCHANYTLNGINAIISAFDRYIAVESTLIGKHNLYNIMASLTSAILAGISDNDIQKGIMQLKNVPGRLEKIEKDGIYFFVDYAHTDDALLNVLQSLLPFKKKRIIVVFGCGGNRDRTKRPRMGKIAKKFADLIILTNDNPRFEKPESIISDILKGIKGRNNVYIEEDRRKAIKLAYEFATTGDIILVAGKGHEDYQIMGNSINHFDDKEVILDIIGDPVEKH